MGYRDKECGITEGGRANLVTSCFIYDVKGLIDDTIHITACARVRTHTNTNSQTYAHARACTHNYV